VARFRFELEPLLTARRHVEHARQRSVAVLDRERLRLESSLRSQQQFITSGKTSLRGELVGALDLGSMRAHASSTIQLMREANRIVIELAGVHKQLDRARAALVEAARERQAIELLKERRFEAWKTKLNKAEDAVLDELAVSAAYRKEPDV
jgi:flagellar FliJ protein